MSKKIRTSQLLVRQASLV